MAVLATVALITPAIVRTIQIVTLTMMARIKFNTFVDIIFTSISTESGIGTFAAKIIEQILTLASIARLICTFIYVVFTFFASVSRYTYTLKIL